MEARNRAVVVGALGVIGRYIVERLQQDENWSIVGLSRRDATGGPRYRHIAVDLLNQQDVEAKLAGLDRRHAHFLCSVPGRAGGSCRLRLQHRAQSRHAGQCRHGHRQGVAIRCTRVVLVTGTKYYGTHLGPFTTPARESDPRHMPPDYYFDQIDWLTAFQKGKAWDWVELRPQTLCGFAPGTPMSILPAIAVYAAVSKELGLPLRFPGQARRL